MVLVEKEGMLLSVSLMNWLIDPWLRWLSPVSSWRGYLLLLAVIVVFVCLFNMRNKKIAPAKTPDAQMLKLDFQGLLDVVENLGTHRRFYAATEVTLDVLFPIAYTAFLSVPMLLGFGAKHGWLTLVPLLGGCADLVENFTLAWLAVWGQLAEKPWLGHVALWAGKAKTLLIYASLVLMILALLVALIQWIKASRL